MSSKTSTKTENKPPDWAKPLFTQSAQVAGALYNSGAGGNPYLGSTVSDLSDTTMGGVNQLAQAGQNWNTAGTRPLYQGIGAASVGPSSASENLAGYASGDYLKGEGNPFYRERLEGELADTAAQVRSSMSGMGRLGSEVSNRTLSDSLGRLRTAGLEEDFNRQTQNQFNAVGMMDQQRNAGLDRALSATGAMAGQDQQQFQNQLTGAGATLQAGGILDEQTQKQLMDEVNKFYEIDNADWQRLGLLQAAAAGSAGPYGTQTGTSRTSNPAGAIGSVLGGITGGK